MDWIARLKQTTEARPDPLASLEKEYHEILTRYWSPAAEGLPYEELQRMFARLDVLFQEITRQGRQVQILTEEGRVYLREDTKELAA
jgi:hypothetical protein